MIEQPELSFCAPSARSRSESLGIWDAPAPSQRHSEPSVEAAERIEPLAKTLRAAVMGFIRGRGVAGATDEEIQQGLGMEGSTQRPRRVELVRAGLVIEASVKRETKSGRTATVWIATHA